MEINQKKLGILLSTGPEHPNFKTAVRLAETALDQEVDVYLYLIDDGVFVLDQDEFLGLAPRGAKLFSCAYAAQRKGVSINDKATFCGLVVFSDLVKGCDRFIFLN